MKAPRKTAVPAATEMLPDPACCGPPFLDPFLRRLATTCKVVEYLALLPAQRFGESSL